MFDRRLAPAYESILSTASTDDPPPPGHSAARTFGNPSGITIDTGLEGRAEQAGQDDDPAGAAIYRHYAAQTRGVGASPSPRGIWGLDRV